MAHAQHDLIPAASEVEDPEPSMSSAGQRKRMLPIISALCVACLLAASGLAGYRTRPHLRRGGRRVGLAATTVSDDDAVWDSVSGAAMIEQMQEQLDEAKGKAKAALQEKLAKLKRETPDWEEITSSYGSTDAWDDIKNSAKLEQLQQAVEDAKASGSDKLEGLQKELEKAQAVVPSVDDVKQQASALWQDTHDAVWDSVSGAAMIEQMQEQLDEAKGEAKAALQEKLAKLKRDTPDWEEITSAYGSTDVWDDIKKSAKLEQLQQAVEDAKASGSNKLERLQEEFEKAQAVVPSVDDVKQRASALWQDKVDMLPDLDDVRANAHKLRDDMQDSVSGMVDNAWGSVKNWF